MKRLLVGTGKLLFGVVTMALIWVTLLILLVVMVWWHLVGLVAWLGGSRARFFLGRWLGAMPFSWAVVLVLGVTALFHANATDVWNREWFRQSAENCVIYLQSRQELKKIGGLW